MVQFLFAKSDKSYFLIQLLLVLIFGKTTKSPISKFFASIHFGSGFNKSEYLIPDACFTLSNSLFALTAKIL